MTMLQDELLERIANALDELAGNGDNRGIASEISMLGDIGPQLALIKGELHEIAGNSKSIAASQRALVNLLENTTFRVHGHLDTDARFLRVSGHFSSSILFAPAFE